MNGTETYAKPTLQQLQWAEQEVGVLIHFLMDNYHPEKEHLIKTAAVRTEMPASSFAPQGWDADQWIRCAISRFIKMKSVGRFCSVRRFWIYLPLFCIHLITSPKPVSSTDAISAGDE